MKKILALIAIILIIVVIIKAGKNTDTPENTNATTTATIMEQANPISLGGFGIADGSYMVAPADVSMTWTGRKVLLENWVDKGSIGLNEAQFEVVNGAIVANKFVVDMTSIKGLSTGKGSGEDMLTNHLKSADFFDVEQFPTSTFVAQTFSAASTTGQFIATGDLTIKGITNTVSIPVTFDISKPHIVGIKGSADIDRTLWDIRYGSGKFFQELGDNVIADTFNLSFDLKLTLPAVQPHATSTATSTGEQVEHQ